MTTPFVTAITETRTLALPQVQGAPAVLVPPLELPSGDTEVVQTPSAKPRWWRSTPAVPPDEFAPDATRANQFVSGMRNALTVIQTNLANDAWVVGHAPEHVGQIYKDYDVAKASALAALANVKSRIDSALAAGAAAAVTTPTRPRYAEIAAGVVALEAERDAFGQIVESRHTEVLATRDKAEREKQEAARVAQKVRDDLKELYGARRDSLVSRIHRLTDKTGFAFACNPYPNNGNKDYVLLAHEAVIPSLVLNASICFGKHNGSYIPADGAKLIGNLAELEDLVDSLMGKPQTDE